MWFVTNARLITPVYTPIRSFHLKPPGIHSDPRSLDFVLTRIDRLEEATIITGELEDAVVRGPGNNDNELAAARAQERLRVVSVTFKIADVIIL